MSSSKLTAKAVQRLMLRSYQRYQSGTISESKAYRENTMLSNILKAIEVTEQEERISALEAALRQTK